MILATNFSPVLLYSSKVRGAYDKLSLGKWEQDPVERLHSQDLNKRASNVDARSEVGQSSLKPTIYLKILKFWLHLEELPENSIAKQCLIMSKELANTGKHSSISSANQIRSQVRNKDTVATGLDDIQETITKLEISKLTSNILE